MIHTLEWVSLPLLLLASLNRCLVMFGTLVTVLRMGPGDENFPAPLFHQGQAPQ